MRKAIFRKGRHRGSTFRRAILDGADLTEGDFSECDFRRASMVEADLMKSAFDGADFRGADSEKSPMQSLKFSKLQIERSRFTRHSWEIRYLAG